MSPDSDLTPTVGQVTAAQRRQVLGHGPATVWLTGLSGAGKSTLAYALEARLLAEGIAAFVLDGDNLRNGLNADLGFSPADRSENIRRVGEVCRLLYGAGLIVISAFISPYRHDREQVRALHPRGGYLEVFLDTSLEVCEQRDVKGLYARARAGDLPDFSGITAPYEPPGDPEVRIDTGRMSVEDAVTQLHEALVLRGVIEHGTTNPQPR